MSGAMTTTQRDHMNGFPCPMCEKDTPGTHMYYNQTVADAALPKAGGTMTGAIINALLKLKVNTFTGTGPGTITEAMQGGIVVLGAGTGSGTFTVKTPTGAGSASGILLGIIKTSATAASAVIATEGTENIGGVGTYSRLDADNDDALFVWTGSEWARIMDRGAADAAAAAQTTANNALPKAGGTMTGTLTMSEGKAGCFKRDSYKVITGTGPATAGNHEVVIFGAGTGSPTLTLPNESAPGRLLRLLKISATAASVNLSVAQPATQLINSASHNVEMDAQYDSMTLATVDTTGNWQIVSKNIS